MKKISTLFVVIIGLFFLCVNPLVGQEKYAILIGGPIDESHYDGPPNGGWFPLDNADFFWTDIFLMRNLLIDHLGFDEENVTVLFHDGFDYNPPAQEGKIYHKRYRKLDPYGPDITDGNCTKGSVESALTYLETTMNDFVFIFVFTHGRYPGNPPVQSDYGILCPEVILPDYSYDNDDDYIMIDEFVPMVANITASKKLIWMQPCYSGGFAPVFAQYFSNGSSTIIQYSTTFDKEAFEADDEMPWDNGTYVSFNENEPENYYDEENGYNGWPPKCHHGEFAFHLFSALNGKTPMYGELYPDPEAMSGEILISEADENSDGIISVSEDFNWAETYQTYYNGGGPIFTQESTPGLSEMTSLEYPTLLCKNITSDLTVNGIVGISTVVHVNNCSLTFAQNSKVFFTNKNAKLIIDSGSPGGSLVLNDNVRFYGDENNKIEINGPLTFVNNTNQSVQFNNKEGSDHFDGLYLNNQNLDYILDNVSFRNTGFHNSSMSLTIQGNSEFISCDTIQSDNGDVIISNSEFISCDIINCTNGSQLINNSQFLSSTQITSDGGNLTILNSEFTDCNLIKFYNEEVIISNNSFGKTGIYLENHSGDSESEVLINNNFFSNTDEPSVTAIELYGYPNFNLHDNSISSGYINGIVLSYCGIGSLEYQKVWNNFISGCAVAGIHNYSSNLIIQNNHIYNNMYGIRLHGTSSLALRGNPNAYFNTQTQEIHDNFCYEVYAAKNSFPAVFNYNVIQDEDNMGNPTDPIIYHATESATPDITHNIAHNCWGTNFSSESDLFPVAEFGYDPIWCPSEEPQPINDPPQDLYSNACAQFADSNYFNAQANFKLVIDLYHESSYARSAMMDLLRVERFVDNNYIDLKEYFLENDTIVNDSILSPLGISLANECDVILGNYPDAIAYYESIIQNPPSAEDSIYAIIDLGHVYYLMEQNRLKSSFIGSMPQYKPVSQKKYLETKNFLLSLLPIDKKTMYIKEALQYQTYGKLIQNIPNPVKDRTTIWYTIEKSCIVTIRISDLTGKIFKEYNIGSQERGNRYAEIEMNNIVPGTYFYSLFVDQQLSDSKKLIVVN